MLGRSSLAGTPAATKSAAEFPVVPFAPTQAKVPLNSRLLAEDQQTSFHVWSWNTPFAALDGDVASTGMLFDAREPAGANPATSWLAYRTGLIQAPPATLASAFADASTSTPLVTNGRVPHVLDSWGAGAPAWYGNSQQGRVALHWAGVFRPAAARSWFSSADAVQLTLGFAGQGYVRVVLTAAGGSPVEITVGLTPGHQLSETEYLSDGVSYSEPFTVNPGDRLDVYYVQNGERWGGVVAKVLATDSPTEALYRAAPVLGCDLFDDPTRPTKDTLASVAVLEVTHDLTSASSMQLQVPLLNPKAHDGVGYEWRRSSDGDDPGVLVCWADGVEQFSLRRGSLIQASGGLVGEEYYLFTGFIDDFEPPRDGLTTIRCIGLERRPLKDVVRNEPDEVSYMCAGYRALTGATEPVYGIAAYDNWAIEYAIADVLLRSGITSNCLAAPLEATTYDGVSLAVQYGTDAFKKFRARGVTGNLLRCERSVRYGNVGYAFEDFKPADDPYVFKPEDSRDAWSRVRELGDRYGYDVRFDQEGHAVLQTRGNPSTVVDVDNTLVTGVAGTKKTHPSAFRGTYYKWAPGEQVALQFTFTGSRVDVAVPRGPTLGNWASMRVVRVSDEFEVGRVQNVNASNSTDIFYYDYRTDTTGKNATLLTLYSGPYDTYRVEVQGYLTEAPDLKERRLDCFFVYAIDPLMPLYPRPLSTAENALNVQGDTTADEQRNLVYVIGRRKAAVTDSEKLQTNPQNPEPEFIVSVAVDTESITNPNAKNYTGARHAAAVFDSSITDQDYADYAARTFIYRYRSPRPPADVLHTVLPVLELRDPLFAVDAQFQSVNEFYVLWATRYTHRFESTGVATTQISTSSWPEFPSYDLRDDIDIDAEFGGVPVANVDVSYTSLTGHVRTNLPSTGVVHASTDADVVAVTKAVTAGSGTPPYLDLTGEPWPPIPGTLQLEPPTLEGAAASGTAVFPTTGLDPIISGGSAGPYSLSDARSVSSVVLEVYTKAGTSFLLNGRYTLGTDRTAAGIKYWYEFDSSARTLLVRSASTGVTPSGVFIKTTVQYAVAIGGVNGQVLADTPYHHFTNVDYRTTNPKVYLPWRHGDGQDTYTMPSSYTEFTVQYRQLMPPGADPYAGVSPFADVTTSELGYLATLTFDALVTGYYRISVRSVHDDTVVAYLTEPTGDPQDPEAHWQYVTAGADRSFNWDFVDQVGVWNERQSADYSASVQGTFDLAEKEPIGAGWTVWNRDRDAGAPGPLALISADVDAVSGAPLFGQGTYAAWYFHLEVQNDALLDKHTADPTKAYPRVVKTREAAPGETAPSYSTDAAAGVIYTHMPEPTQGELTIQDWVAAFAYDASDPSHATTDANWGAADADATLHNEKPVRLQFTVKPRVGVLWTGHTDDQQVKLNRHVHLRALIFDQFVVDAGASYPDTTVPQRTVYSRRMSEDSHTLSFPDTGWRSAKTFRNATYPTGTLQWVFRPADFRKKFREIDNEPLAFGAQGYLQLTEVPSWDLHRAVSGASARYVMGFIGYLFYLSAWVQDRSGRRSWMQNRRFVDTSKITCNQVADWWDPASPGTPATTTTYRADWPADPVRQQRRTVVCRQWTNEPGWAAEERTRWAFSTGDIGDLLLRFKWQDLDPFSVSLSGSAWPVLDLDEHSKWHRDGGRTQLPGTAFTGFGNLTRQLGTSSSTRLGNWTWEPSPMWVPCPSRDWHAHFLIPPMVDSDDAPAPQSENWYSTVDVRGYDSRTNEGGDEAAVPVWSSWCRDMSEPYNSSSSGLKRFAPGSRIDTTQDPNKPALAQNAHDYARQTDLVHYEDLRGLYSRGPRPAEQPKKVAPAPPYYLNLYSYDHLIRTASLPRNQLDGKHHSDLTKWYARVTNWFRMSFRSEYVVESERYFPTDRLGREYLRAVNAERTRYLAASEQAKVYYDGGAWVGWKDDFAGSTHLGTPTGIDPDTGQPVRNVFETNSMPVRIGPTLPQTTDCYMHLCLVNERRAGPV